jgi:hypothetical protein
MQETLEKLQRELSQSLVGLSAKETQTMRAPGKWTIQQIAEHLVLSYAATCTVVAARVAKGTPTKASPSLPQRIGQFTITTCGIFPQGHSAPSAVTPRDTPLLELTGNELTAAISSSLLGMDAALTVAEGLFGATRRAISHIRLGPMSVRQWRRFHLAHGEHHLKQILATRRILA